MTAKFSEEKKEGKNPVKKIDMPLLPIWEFLGLLDVSIDCFDLAIKNQEKEYDMIIPQIGNYAKERVEKFTGDNTYQYEDEQIASYDIFYGYVFHDADIHEEISFEEGMEKHTQRERRRIHWGTSSMIVPANVINSDYLLDTYPHIIAKKHKRFFDVFTDREVFKSLYERAKEEIEINKDEITDYRELFVSKMNSLNAKLDSYSDSLVSNLINNNLIMWYVLLQKYIRETSTLITNALKPRITTKQLLCILRYLCGYLGVDAKSESFMCFIKEIIDATPSTLNKYINSPTMGYEDQAYTKTLINTALIFEKLDAKNSKVKDIIRTILSDNWITEKNLSLEIKQTLERLRNDYL
jgi:hypothetical protein